jgi:hypothetical protein
MAFPVAPTNGQIALINGVSYTYASATNSWTRNIGVQGNVNASNVTAGNLSVTTNLTVTGNSVFTGNLLPSANITYDLGSATNRWRDIFLSGNTINLGGATIKADDDSGAIALIPKVTVANPHPTGIVFSPAGTLSTVATSAGQVTVNAIKDSANTASQAQTTTFGNIVVTGNITSTSGFFLGNGSLLSGVSAGGSGNYANANVASYLVTYSGNLAAGNISVTGNLSASYILGNGSQLTGLPATYSNTNVQSYLPTYSGNLGGTLTTASQPYITGVGSLSSLTVSGNVSTGNISGTLLTGTLATAAQPNITSVGSLTSLTVTGNVTAANLNVTGNIVDTGPLSIITGASGNVALAPGGTSVVIATTTGANVTGTLNVTGNIITAANISAAFLSGNGSALTGLPATYSNTNVSSYLTANSGGLVSVTTGLQIPSGTTDQRPASPAPGSLRYNSTLSRVEAYMPGAGWSEVVGDSYNIEYLSIAGGGGGGTGGGQDSGGGGGAGGVVSGTLTGMVSGVTFSILVGAGAAGFTAGGSNGNSGTATSITATGYSFTTALAGGYGVGESGNRNGGSGWGSGGGAGGWSGSKGTGTSPQGYDGGATGLVGGGSSGGGGGAGGAGTHDGGVGTVTYNAWGSATSKGQNVGGTYYFAGGGGGAGDARNANYGGAGGYGGGGAGGWNGAPGSGTVNTGGGGGGGTGSSYGPQTSGAGGSGIVIIRYQGSQKGTGGTVTTAGGYTYHTFTGSSTFTT